MQRTHMAYYDYGDALQTMLPFRLTAERFTSFLHYQQGAPGLLRNAVAPSREKARLERRSFSLNNTTIEKS